MDKERLINAVQKHPALWNKTCDAYRTKKSHKDQLWETVAEECGYDGLFYLLFVSVRMYYFSNVVHDELELFEEEKCRKRHSCSSHISDSIWMTFIDRQRTITPPMQLQFVNDSCITSITKAVSHGRTNVSQVDVINIR